MRIINLNIKLPKISLQEKASDHSENATKKREEIDIPFGEPPNNLQQPG